jgi:hypothetical protein
MLPSILPSLYHFHSAFLYRKDAEMGIVLVNLWEGFLLIKAEEALLIRTDLMYIDIVVPGCHISLDLLKSALFFCLVLPAKDCGLCAMT